MRGFASAAALGLTVGTLLLAPAAGAPADGVEAASGGSAAAEALAGIVVAKARLAEAEAGWARVEARVQAGLEAGGEAPVLALAGAIRQTEAALAALRDGIAGAAAQEQGLIRALAMDRAETDRLVAALVAASRRQGAPRRLHPGGPVAAARAAILVEHAEAGLATEARGLRLRLEELAAVRRLRESGEADLAEALGAVEGARDALRRALAADGPSAPPAPDSPAALLIAESETLTDLAARLAGEEAGSVPEGVRLSARHAPEAAVEVQRLAAPVAGVIARGFAEADAGGERLPGVTWRAMPRALVTAPAEGVVRYVGPFLDWGGVVVIEPGAGTLVVLAGLAAVTVAEGDRLQAGAPVGFLGGAGLEAQDYLKAAHHGSDAFAGETLYMEVWRHAGPVDPAAMLADDRG